MWVHVKIKMRCPLCHMKNHRKTQETNHSRVESQAFYIFTGFLLKPYFKLSITNSQQSSELHIEF